MRNKIIAIAQKEIGYKEYSNNHTKYGEWFGVQDEWCNIFVSWLANQIGILDTLIPKQAYVPNTVKWYKDKGLFKAKGYNPNTGDIIFFDYNSNGTSDHIGIVEKCENENIYTIEGNKSQMVKRCMYNVNNPGIYGFGLVQYSQEENKNVSNEITYSTIQKGSKGNLVRIGQEKLIAKKYSCGPDGADGDFGDNTEAATKQLQRDAGLVVDGIIGVKTWAVLNSDFMRPNKIEYPGFFIKEGQTSDYVGKVQTRLIELGYNCGPAGADKKFGINTAKAVEKFQKDNGLVADKIVGPKTWNKLFA